jgi:hypothetical protein
MDDRGKIKAGDIVIPQMGPHLGEECEVIIVEERSGRESGWFTVRVKSTGRRVMYMERELRKK